MRIAFCLFLCLSVTITFAQDLVLTPIAPSLCKPGVVGKSPGKGLLYDYSILPNRNLAFGDKDDTQRSFNRRMRFKLKIPVIHRPDFTLMLGFAHYREEYRVQDSPTLGTTVFSDLNDRDLKSSNISLYMIKPINNKFYVALKADASFNGDYSGLINFDNRYQKYNFAGILGVKPRPSLEYGVGVLYRTSFVPTNFPVLPFFVYNQTFNDKWGIESALPVKVKVRHDINPKSHILFGPEFVSRSYSIDNVNFDTEPFNEFVMRRSELRFGVAYEHQVANWVWFNVEAGYAHNFATEFHAIDFKGDVQQATEVMPSDGMFFKVGVFISPPRKKRH